MLRTGHRARLGRACAAPTTVVSDAYDAPTLQAFQEYLAPAFARSLPEKYGTPQKADEYNASK